MAMECFFPKSVEAKRRIKDLEEDYEIVEIETFSVNTKRRGPIPISVVYYDKEKTDGLFTDEEWEALCNSRGIGV